MAESTQTIQPIAGILKRGAVQMDYFESENWLQCVGGLLYEKLERGTLHLRRLFQFHNNRCRVCNNLDPQGHPKSLIVGGEWRLGLIDIPLPRVYRSATRRRHSCEFCVLLTAALVLLIPEATSEHYGRCSIGVLSIQAGEPVVAFFSGDSAHKGVIPRIEIYTPLGKQPPWPTLGTAAEVPDYAGSERTFGFIEDCLVRCVNSHSVCQRQQSTYFPRRIIDLGSDNTKIRLLDSQSEGMSDRYVALSYCWGESLPFTTTQETISQRKRNIEWHLLPRTFQDAATVCRRFNIQYLWIDSLCIIQNREADWEAESAKMADIYGNAYFTIAAVSSFHSNMPFLVTREPTEQFKTFDLNYQAAIGRPCDVKARQNSGPWDSASCYGPLSTRAWAWQERHLSVRVMQFTTVEVKWHCMTEDRCECTTTSPIPKDTPWKDDPKPYDRWHHLVGDYSSRKMTYASDRLPAMSGAASLFQQSTQTEYLAGLWRGNLELDLLWVRQDSAPLSKPLRTRYRAPSWSWASIDSQINYLYVDNVHSLIVVEDAWCSLASSNVFGEVNGGSITISAQASKATLIATNPLDPDTYTLKHPCFTRPMHPDCVLVEGMGQDLDLLPVQTVQRTLPEETLQTEVDPINRLVWCILGCDVITKDGDSSTKFLVVGESRSSPGRYERLGLATVADLRFKQWDKSAVLRKFIII